MSPLEDWYALPIQGRPERLHLYEWIAGEEEYVAAKFDDQRDGHDESMASGDLEAFWFRQVTQYLSRATAFINASKNVTGPDKRFLEMKAQQAMAKAMMTSKGMCESAIRVYGPMPKPGVSSGEIEEWK